MCMHAYIHIYIHTYAYTYVYRSMHIFIYYVCINILYIYIYIYMYIYTKLRQQFFVHQRGSGVTCDRRPVCCSRHPWLWKVLSSSWFWTEPHRWPLQATTVMYTCAHTVSRQRCVGTRYQCTQSVGRQTHTHTHTHMHIWFQSSMKTIQYFMRTTWFAPFQQLQTTSRVQGQQTGANPPQLQHVLQLLCLSKRLIRTLTQAHTHTHTNTNTNTHMRAHTLTNT